MTLLKVDDDLLKQVFDDSVLDNIVVRYTSVRRECTIQYLQSELGWVLNYNKELGCMLMANGSICIYGINARDYAIANHALRLLINRLHINTAKFASKYWINDMGPTFMRPNHLTTYYDVNNKKIPPPWNMFYAKVAFSITGVKYDHEDACVQVLMDVRELKVMYELPHDALFL